MLRSDSDAHWIPRGHSERWPTVAAATTHLLLHVKMEASALLRLDMGTANGTQPGTHKNGVVCGLCDERSPSWDPGANSVCCATSPLSGFAWEPAASAAALLAAPLAAAHVQ